MDLSLDLGPYFFCGLSQAPGAQSMVGTGALVLCFPGAACVFSLCQLLMNKRTLQNWVWLMGACLACYCGDRLESSPQTPLKSFSPARIWAWFPQVRNLHGIEMAWAMCRGSLYSSCCLVRVSKPLLPPIFLSNWILRGLESRASPSRSVPRLLLAM